MLLRCIQYDKDTILKAIYNRLQLHVFVNMLYSVWQRYNFESNLQQDSQITAQLYCCIQYDKDTILKAIYNQLRAATALQRLYSVWQRYNFESNLQPNSQITAQLYCCIQYDKDTILKAIYNTRCYRTTYQSAVFSMTKIQFWKQFTT